MSEAGVTMASSECVLLAVPVGRNDWTTKQATLHYEAARLVKAEGIDFPQTGPLGLTGTLYVVKEALQRDLRRIMRVERQKVVNGQVVEVQNWGEIEETLPLPLAG